MTRIAAALVWIGICLFAVSTSVQAAATQDTAPLLYHNEEEGFSVTLPAGWQHAPPLMMTTLEKEAELRSGEVELSYVAAFLPKTLGSTPSAYIVIAVMHYPNGRQISKREIRDMISKLTGSGIEEVRRSSPKGSLASNISAVSDSKVEYFEQKKMLIWQFRAELAGVGELQSCNAGFFGRKTLVLVASNAPLQSFEAAAPLFAGVEKSFRFDLGMGYEEIEWYESRGFAIALLVGSGATLAALFRAK
jgi:hypothetical protein